MCATSAEDRNPPSAGTPLYTPPATRPGTGGLCVEVPGRLGESLRRCGAILQVALDFTDLWAALRIARSMPRSPAIALEAGTPLIKAHGMDSVRALAAIAGGRPVVADTKTADAGALEASMARDSGADAVTVLSASHDSTVEAMLGESQGRLAVYMDLMTSGDPLADAERARSLGVHVALIHLGVDVQKALGERAAARARLVEEVAQVFKGPVAVAGGVKPREAGSLAAAGASIVVIGGGVTRAADPGQAAMDALKSLSEAGYEC